MDLVIAQKTLERLEWPRVVMRLHAHCRTPGARARLAAPAAQADEEPAAAAPGLAFEATVASARERLAETGEARTLLDAGREPPLGGSVALEEVLGRVAKGGALTAHQLLDVRATLQALNASARFLRGCASLTPRLAALGEPIQEQSDLERRIGDCIEPSGELRDGASPALREVRREARQLSAELERRLEHTLRSPQVARALSDRFITVRNDRYVLPVRADARGAVRGIVHDVSASGATLYVEPEAVVELNNRLKRAQLAGVREAQRVLRGLGERVAACAEVLRVGARALEALDLAFARAALAREMQAAEPVLARDGVFDLPQLRHPLIPLEEAVPNDLQLGVGQRVMVISGPNGGGKTVVMKALALAALMARAGLHVPAGRGARVAFVDSVLADIGDEQDIRQSLSTFSAHMANVAEIVRRAGQHVLVVLDELGVGTDPSEGAALAQAVLERLAESGARAVVTTHYNLLKEMAAVSANFCNASFEFDPETLAPTYRLRVGEPGASSAAAVAARMGMPTEILERADALLDREDRRLDRMLSELASSRAILERERVEVSRLRVESESARDAYRVTLLRLQTRRDALFQSMRADLDRAFGKAHAEVASVIRDLQRGGGAREAAQARQQLLRLDADSRKAAEHAGLQPEAQPVPEPGRKIDWRRARPGDRVRVPGGGEGALESLPDRRGRVAVRVGAGRLLLPAERVRAATMSDPPSPLRASGSAASETAEREAGGGCARCDLRGRRVEEALEAVAAELDRAAAQQRESVLFVHGFGSGALRRAVREFLRASPYIEDIAPGGPDRGGDGTTVARLRR